MARIARGVITLTDIKDGDQGIAGARNAVRYLYKETTSDTVPDAPQATITWSTGSLSDITTGWSEEPPEVDATGTGRPWVSALTFHQASSSSQAATTTATGSTPKKGFTFDGVVTFSNNNLTDGTNTYDPATVVNSGTTTIDGGKITANSITSDEINTNTVLTESLLANTADITGDLTVTSGKITVQDTDTVINLDPDAQYPFRISQGTEDVVRLGSGTLDPFIKGAFIRGMPVQSINEADLTTFVRNIVGVSSEEKTETETLTRLPTGGNVVFLEADNITTGLTTVLTLETLEGTQSWLHQYEEASDWDSGDSIFFKYTMQGYNGSAWVNIPNWVDRYIYGSGYRVDGAIVGWSINESHSETIENNTYTHFRMVVQNMVSDFGGGEHPTSTGINCDFKLTVVTGSQVNSDNYVNSFSINDTSGVITVGRTGSLGDLTADISNYVSNQVSALVDSAPESLDTLNELAAALGDDANFSTTVTNSIATKASKSGDTFTGDVKIEKTSPTLTLKDSNSATGSYPKINFDTTNNQGVTLYHTEFDSELPVGGYGLVLDASAGNTQYPTTGTLAFVVKGEIYAGDTTLDSTNKVYHAGNFTDNSSNWDTAYGWGDHSSAGYSTTDTTYTAGSGLSLTGTEFKIGWNATDTFTGTYPLVWKASDIPYTSTWLNVNGATDTLHSVNFEASGTVTASGGNSSNWNTAYGWGDHSTQGYLTSETNDYVDSMTFSTSNGTLRLGRTGSLSDLVVDLDGRYQLDTAPSAPSITSTSVVNETIEVVFSQSSTSGIEYYEVWSDGGIGSYSLIAKITEQDFASSMSVVDVTFSAGTVNYRVFAVKNGIYSTASTTSRAFTAPSLDVANLQVVPDLNVFHIGYNIPDSRFVDHVEIYADANASSSSLSRSNATIVYSGNGESFIYNISPSERDMFHQFWVEVV